MSVLKNAEMLLLGFSNNPVNKAYQIYMGMYKEAHKLIKIKPSSGAYGRRVLLETSISSLLLLHLYGFLCLETTPITLPWGISGVNL